MATNETSREAAQRERDRQVRQHAAEVRTWDETRQRLGVLVQSARDELDAAEGALQEHEYAKLLRARDAAAAKYGDVTRVDIAGSGTKAVERALPQRLRSALESIDREWAGLRGGRTVEGEHMSVTAEKILHRREQLVQLQTRAFASDAELKASIERIMDSAS
jgi:hypothetical protein